MIKTLSALLFILCLSFTAHAEKITAAGDPWPPFLDPESPDRGISAQIARAAFATQGYELSLEFVPWARAIDGVKSGDYDVLIATWLTEKRTRFLAFSEPYLANEIKFIKRKGDVFEYQGLESLEGKTVGTVRGYGYGDDFQTSSKFQRDEGVDLMVNIRKLVANRIDLTLEDEVVARSIINKSDPGLIGKIEFSGTPLSSNKLYLSTGLANPRHEAIIQAFNKGLAEIKKDGTFARILAENGLK